MDPYTKAMFGCHAAQVPLQLCIQDMQDGTVLLVGASKITGKDHPLRFGSSICHQLFQGDAVFRPHWVGETASLVG